MKVGRISRSLLFVCAFTSVVANAQSSNTPELPRVYLDTTYVPPTGQTWYVPSGGDLQGALNAATPGDTVSLQAGATFVGNFVLPLKSGSQYIHVRTSAPDTSLPAPGTRVGPSYSTVIARIVSPNSSGAIRTVAGAHHYRFVGIEFGLSSGNAINYGIVLLGDSGTAQNTSSQVPHDLVIDRCYIHGNATGDVSRGVQLNSASTAVIDSYISNIHGIGFDTQAICGWNGPGPFKIVNNYLEAAGENVMFGGADPSIVNLVPSDIEFRINYLFKPLSWRVGDPSYAGIHWSIKNLFELKNSQRVLVEGNLMENSWGDAQTGWAIDMKSVNQGGNAPWSVTQDVTFRNNKIRRTGSGMTIMGRDNSQPGLWASRFLVANNVFEQIDGVLMNGSGILFQVLNNASYVTIDHNTGFQTGNTVTADLAVSAGFVYSNNLANHNLYGVKGSGVNSGLQTLTTYYPGYSFAANVLTAGPASLYPFGNYFPATMAAVGFVNLAGGNYRLLPSSPYFNGGTDGADVGADIDALEAAMSGTVPVDTTAPGISGVATSGVGTSAATVVWTTNEGSDSQVEYGLTTSYGATSALNTAMVTSHSQGLTGLAANTLYHYRVRSRDTAGNLAMSTDYTFHTAASADTTPPVISAVTAGSITTSGATVTWTTNEASDTQVEYGTTTSYGATSALNTAMVTSHSQGLTGLAANTLYHYRAKSRDAAGNLAVSVDFTVRTATAADTTPPVISAVNLTSITWSGARVNWTTNEASDSQVEYGLTTAYGSLTPLNTTKVLSHTREMGGLTANTLYHYRVRSRDAAGNLALSGDFTFTTAPPDTTPPVMSAVTAGSITASSARITWTTNEASDTQVEYGLTTSYGSQTSLNTQRVLSHAQNVSGLAANTLYHYRVKSRDLAGNLAVSGDYTIRTQ